MTIVLREATALATSMFLIAAPLGACGSDAVGAVGNASDSGGQGPAMGDAGSAGMSITGDGVAGEAGQRSSEPSRSEGAASIQLAEPACSERTSWALPDENDPVTATERGTAAVDGRPKEHPFIDCLVHESGGVWDFEARMMTRDTTMSFYCQIDPDVPCKGSFQLRGPGIRQDISSTQAGPCFYTVIDIAEGSIWANVECAGTRERDLKECGAATIHFAFDHCDTSRAAYLGL